MEISTETMKQSFQESLFVYQTAVSPEQFEDDLRSIAALALELLSNNTRTITINPAEYGISGGAVDFLYHFNVDLKDDSLVFLPGSARDTAVRAFGQAVASLPGFHDLGARFGLEFTSDSSPPASASASSGTHTYPSPEETEPAACARADPRYERRGPLPRSSPGRSPEVQGHSEWHTASSAAASPRHSGMPRKPVLLPPNDNRFADSETPATLLPPLTGLHIVEIMEDFSYHLISLTTRIPFRILFRQCKRLIADYSTRDDVVKLFNAVCCRIEETGVALKFWLPEDVPRASVGQSSNNLISMFNVLKSMIQKSLEDLGSEQQLGKQATEHYTTIWQLKEDFARMIRNFWRENSTEPAYVMFAFDLHQKLAYLNVKWTLGLPMRMNQDPNVRDRGVDMKDARDTLDLTRNVPDVFSQLFVDAIKALRAYFSKELQQSLTNKEHLEHLSLVQWLIDNAKSNVVRPSANEVRSSSIGHAANPEDTLRLLEVHGLQPTGTVYDDAAVSSSFGIQGGDTELQLALEISKQETSVQRSDLDEQTRYALAVSASESPAQPANSGVGSSAERSISRNDYDQYGAAFSSPMPPSDVLLQIDKDRTFDDHHQSGRSHEPQHQPEQLAHEQQGNRVLQQQQGAQHGLDSDSGMGMMSGSSSALQQMTNHTEMPVAPHGAHLTGQMSNGTPTQTFHLARDVVRDTSATNGVHSPPPVENKTYDEDSDSGDSKITINDSDDEEQQQQHRDSDLKHEPTNLVDAAPASHSLPARHPSSPSAVGVETDMQLTASQILQLLKEHDYVQVNRLLRDLQGNVQQKLSLRSLGRDFLLEIVGNHATADELAQTVENFVQMGRVNRATLITICQKLHIVVSDQSDEELKHLICMREKQQ